MKTLSLSMQKFWPMLKFLQKKGETDKRIKRQTDKRKKTQRKNYMALIYRCGGIKLLHNVCIIIHISLRLLKKFHLDTLVLSFSFLDGHYNIEGINHIEAGFKNTKSSQLFTTPSCPQTNPKTIALQKNGDKGEYHSMDSIMSVIVTSQCVGKF